MSVKKIVKEPTPESSPFLYYGDDNNVIENFDPRIGSDINQSFSPVSFDDIKLVDILTEKYRDVFPNCFLLPKFFNNRKFIKSVPVLSIILFFVAFAISLTCVHIFVTTAMETNIYYENSILGYSSNLIVGAISWTIMTATWLYYSTIPYYYFEYNFVFKEKDKELLQNKVFLDISSYKERKNHKKTIKSIIKAVNHINNNNRNDNTNLCELKNLYNEYIQLLSFMLTNEDNISQELYDDYDQQLKELSQKIIKESDSIIMQKEEYVEKDKENLKEVNQENIDNEAMTIFPKKYSNFPKNKKDNK